MSADGSGPETPLESSRLRRILVPIDFNQGSRPTADYALALAEAHGASVDLLHVWEMPRLAGRSLLANFQRETRTQIADHYQKELTQTLSAFIGALKPAANVKVVGLVERGRPASKILEIAEQGQYDLVVVWTAGRTGMAHFFVGSVAENLVRLCRVPVLTLRIQGHEESR